MSHPRPWRRPGIAVARPAPAASPIVLLLVLLALAAAHVLVAEPARAQQTFGGDPLDRVLASAAQYGDDCADASRRLPAAKLAALVIAPTFPETGAPTNQAPSPMTLSRYDVDSDLYSYGNPDTYLKAFWTPGIGAWQWDDASLTGLSASQRIDQAFVIDHTTRIIAQRWCSGRNLDSVWSLWYGCGSSRCETIYNTIYQGGALVNVTSDDLVGRFGGMEQRTCTIDNGAAFTCWFVDPARAQGYAGFAIDSWGRSPVPSPFYAFRVGSHEERHFLATHSGYDRDIRGRLLLGQNSRGTGAIDWTTGSGLCDVTAGIGDCLDGGSLFDVKSTQVMGTYTPLAGDFDGDGKGDIFWYGPGSQPDAMWYGRGDHAFTYRPVSATGVFTPLVGDFNGDGRDDIFWYGPGDDPDSLWVGRSTRGFSAVRITARGTYEPFVGDFDGDGRDDIFWYAPGTPRDWVWWGTPTSGSFGASTHRFDSVAQPVAANFDGVGGDDIFWYRPGPDSDVTWLSTSTRGAWDVRDSFASATATFEPSVGDFDDDGKGDIFWYAPDRTRASVWRGTGSGFSSSSLDSVTGARPTVADFDGNGGDDILLYVPGPTIDRIFASRS